MVWLQGSIEHAKLSIKKLQKLFDIIPSLKSKRSPKKQTSSVDIQAVSDSIEASSGNKNAVKATPSTSNRKGRIAKSEYSNVEEIN